MLRAHVLLLAAMLCALSPSPAKPAEFDPEAHFPKETFFYASLDARALREGFAQSLPGKLLSHPGVAPAIAALPGLARHEPSLWRDLEDFERATGLDPLSLAALFEGEIALTVPSMDRRYGPGMLLSVNLGTKRRELLALVERLGALFLAGTRGGAPVTSTVEGHTVTTWPVEYGPSLRYVTLGNHLVFCVGPELEGTIRRFEGKEPEEDSLRLERAFARGKLQVTGLESALTVFVHSGRIREAVMQLYGGGSDADEALRFFGVTGLDSLTAATFRFGFRDGILETRLALDSAGGLKGALGILDCVGPAEGGGALALAPAAAREIALFSLDVGRVARAVREMRTASPTLDRLVGEIEEGLVRRTGLSVERDLSALPRLSITAFSAVPPAGGIVPDLLAIVRRSEIEPFLVLLDRLVRRLGGTISEVECAGRPVACVALRDPGPLSLALAFTTVDDEWMLIASSPQSVSRYFAFYREGPSAAGDPRIEELARTPGASESAWVLLRGGRDLAAAWNDAVSATAAIAPLLRERLEPLGIDPALLPPGEDFAALIPDGHAVLARAEGSLTLRTRALLPNVLGSRTLLAHGLLAAAQARLREELGIDRRRQLAADRLRAIGAAMHLYAAASGTRAFPYDPSGSVAAFQILLDAGHVEAAGLVHPLGRERAALPGPDGKVRLASGNVSYEIVPWKQGPADHAGRLLAYERAPYDGGGRHALFVGGNVEFLPEQEFAKVLEEQRAKYGRKE